MICSYSSCYHIGGLVTWWPSIDLRSPSCKWRACDPHIHGMWALYRDPHHEDDGQWSLYSWSIGSWSLCQRAQARVYIDGCIPRITGKMRKEIKIKRYIAWSHYISMGVVFSVMFIWYIDVITVNLALLLLILAESLDSPLLCCVFRYYWQERHAWEGVVLFGCTHYHSS